jgi:hypothetical protein
LGVPIDFPNGHFGAAAERTDRHNPLFAACAVKALHRDFFDTSKAPSLVASGALQLEDGHYIFLPAICLVGEIIFTWDRPLVKGKNEDFCAILLRSSQTAAGARPAPMKIATKLRKNANFSLSQGPIPCNDCINNKQPPTGDALRSCAS